MLDLWTALYHAVVYAVLAGAVAVGCLAALTVVGAVAAVRAGARTASPLPGLAAREAVVPVVVELDGHHYALTVDSVDDVVEAAAETASARMPLKGGWARIAAGVVEADGDMLLLIDVAALIAGPQSIAA